MSAKAIAIDTIRAFLKRERPDLIQACDVSQAESVAEIVIRALRLRPPNPLPGPEYNTELETFPPKEADSESGIKGSVRRRFPKLGG